MITIDIRSDIDRAIRSLNEVQKRHVPFATALALTRTAQKVKEAEIAEMRRVFDRPTPFTLRSLFLKRATKQQQVAIVGIKDYPRHTGYFKPQVYGGTREPKAFEQLLRRAGILRPGRFAVPGAGARLDRYGNMRGGQITQILSALHASRDPAANRSNSPRSGRKARRAAYFVGGQPRGVWQRLGGRRVVPVLVFIASPRYGPRFRFYEVGKRVVAHEFSGQFARALAHALATAR